MNSKEFKILVAIIPHGEVDFVRRMFIVMATDKTMAVTLAERQATREGLTVVKYRSMVIGLTK